MKAHNLRIDPEEFSMDIIPQLEKSFGLAFQLSDLAEVRTFGQLCAVVQDKLTGPVAHDCTSQQAFYKAREAVRKHTTAEHLSPDSTLLAILPSGRQRRQVAAAIEQELQMKLDIVGMSAWQMGVGCLALLISLGGLFVDRLLGLLGLAVALLWLRLADRWGTTLTIVTMRDLTERMSTRYYRASRRNPQTVNPREITGRLRLLFSREYGVPLSHLTPEAIL